MKLPSYIVKSRPAVIVVFCDFRIPLGHRHFHAFSVVSPCSSDLVWNHCIPVHRKSRSGIWFQRFVQINFHYRFLNFEFQVFVFLFYPVYFLASLFISRNRSQTRDWFPIYFGHQTPVCIQSLVGHPLVHHGVRLKGIPIQVKIHYSELIRRVVRVFYALFSVVRIVRRIYIDVHFVLHILLIISSFLSRQHE